MTLALRVGTLIDGSGRDPLRSAVLLVENGRIMRVGTESEVTVPAAARRLDYDGLTVVPGFIDCHVHLVFSGKENPLADVLAEDDFTILLRAAENARQALRAGVTTVRDLGGRAGTTMALRDAIDRGIMPGPHIMACGAPITLTGGHCHFLGMEADTESDVRLAVRRQVKQGVDGLKIMSTGGRMTPRTNVRVAQYTVEQISAAVQETRRANMTIAAHGHGTAGIRNAVRAGVDTVEHCSWIGEDGLEFDEQTARLMATTPVRVVATLTPVKLVTVRDPASLDDAGRETLNFRPSMVANYRRMRELGVRFAAGTDAGVTRTPLDSMPWELQIMVDELGFTPLEAIQAATAEAADAIGLAHDRGTLQSGRRADMLIVNGDPANNIADLRRVHAVLKDGEVVVQGQSVLDAPPWSGL